MPARKKKAEINLLPQEEFASSTVGRVLHWLLSTFRYLVITTEMIVIGAFISRFYFDSRLGDLNDEIKQKKEFVESYVTFERDFRIVLHKLDIFKGITNPTFSTEPLVRNIFDSTPIQVKVEEFSFSEGDKVIIEASSLTEEAISKFITNLRLQKRFASVELSQIESKSNSPFISFTVVAKLKGVQEDGS